MSHPYTTFSTIVEYFLRKFHPHASMGEYTTIAPYYFSLSFSEPLDLDHVMWSGRRTVGLMSMSLSVSGVIGSIDESIIKIDSQGI